MRVLPRHNTGLAPPPGPVNCCAGAISSSRAERSVRRVRYSVAASLDGYIAGPAGDYDWIPDEPGYDFRGFLDTIDTLLVGRRTYEVALRSGPWPEMPGTRTLVFSRTL
ncbi:MAG: hypothetical protein GWM92_07860, partial [Gemmatimonadetes bacterium]|nr:hypothetical protein [Gemmatimonadota bacterium]NIV60717.1 hypothetical protein [Gemmatimonadota bacterium]NIV82113.1 hypothetical protein [Gemmatimonadota bacterium]NIY39353.1 hypothetical protein [Gemmatimonadota bacterium]